MLLTVKVPPYCGVPSLSHQFPVPVVVVVTVDTDVVDVVVDVADAVDVVEITTGVEEVVVVFEAVVVVDELQDTKIIDATSKSVTNPQMIPFFINASL